MITAVYLIVVVLYLIYVGYIKPLNKWKNLGIPYVPGLPIMGSWKRTGMKTMSMGDETNELYRKMSHHKLFGAYFFQNPVVVIADPELIKQVTVKDFDNYMDHSEIFFAKKAHPTLSNNLFALNGSQWKDMRSTLSPTFTGSKMRSMFHLIVKCAEQMIEPYKAQAAACGREYLDVELKEIFSRMGTDVIASTAFGIDVNSFKNKDNEFFVMGKAATNFDSTRMLFIALFPKIAQYLKYTSIPTPVCEYFTSIIKDTINLREQKNIIRPDMLQVLMQLRKENLRNEDVEDTENIGGKTLQLSDDDVAAQAFIFFLAGFDTISNGTSWTVYELALNPDIQQRLYEEVKETYDNCNGNVSYDDLSKMKYMEMVFSEGLRKWPPAIFTDRLLTKPVTLEANGKQFKFEEKTILNLPIIGLHRDEKYWPNPMLFDPERFSDENKKNIVPYTYLPFGIGPRNCIGSRFAIMQAKLILFYTLKNFEILITEKSTVPPAIAVKSSNMICLGGFNVGFKLRKN